MGKRNEDASHEDAFEHAFGKKSGDGGREMEMVRKPTPPDTPPNYFGLQHWAAAKQKKWLDGQGGDNAPAENEYVLGNNKLGGWGAWTLSRLQGGYEDASSAFISHSFGMIGTSQSPKLYIMNSYLKNWQKSAGKNISGVA